MAILSQARLKQQITYDPTTGSFLWAVSRRGLRKGAEAGFLTPAGYLAIRIDGALYYAHRLACLYMTGALPAHSIDHINNDKSDNRWANLRDADKSENAINYSRPAPRSGYRGVSQTGSGKWAARIRKNYKNIHLGSYDSPKEAHEAYVGAAPRVHGEFARAS